MKVEGTGRRGRSSKQLLDYVRGGKILEIERGHTRWHFAENSFRKRLWAGKTNCGMAMNRPV